MEDCTFCKIISGELPAHVIKQDEDIIVFQSLDGHPLIVPKAHIQDVFSLDPDNAAKVMREAVSISNAPTESLMCDGINLVQSNGPAAGQDVFHFHLHIKPRWHNDGVILSWDTSEIGDQKSAELADRLRPLISPA